MVTYHPSKAPNPEEWLEVGESIRIQLVLDSHIAAQIEFEEGADKLHAAIHGIRKTAIKISSRYSCFRSPRRFMATKKLAPNHDVSFSRFGRTR